MGDFARAEGERLDKELMGKLAPPMKANEVDKDAFIKGSAVIYEEFGKEVPGGSELSSCSNHFDSGNLTVALAFRLNPETFAVKFVRAHGKILSPIINLVEGWSILLLILMVVVVSLGVFFATSSTLLSSGMTSSLPTFSCG